MSALFAAPLSATVVYQDNFPGSSLSGDWSTSTDTVDTTVRVSDNTLTITDNRTDSTVARAFVPTNKMASFDTTQSGQSTLVVSFDWQVSSLLGTTAATPRFQIYGATSASPILSIGFGSASLSDGDANRDLFFYAANANAPTPSASNAIGFTGSGWNSGFNFGDYNTSIAANNTTSGYINFTVTYVDQSDTALVTVTNGAFSTDFTVTGVAATSFASTSSTNSFQFTSGSSTISTSMFQNLTVSVIPEPSTAVTYAGALALVGALGCRRRRVV